MVCRICEQVVPVELVTEHSKACVSAHQRQYKFLCANEGLREASDEIAAQLLNHGMELRDPTLYPVVFPSLYVYLLGDVAVRVQPTDPDGDQRLQTIRHGMSFFKPPPGVDASMFGTLMSRLEEKIRANAEVSQALDEWKATTEANSTPSLSAYQTMLGDFEFIRRLSSGAFARVYLARKKSTRDLVAVKVIKRSLVNLKNQLQKVIVERDILIRLDSNFLVHFCMFFSAWRRRRRAGLFHRN